MTRKEILGKTTTTFYKKLAAFLDTLTPIELEKLELDLWRSNDGTQRHWTLITYVQEAGRRNCGAAEYFWQ